MKFIISFMTNDLTTDFSKLFGIFNTEDQSLEFIDLPDSSNLNFTHGMGICHTANFLCGGIIPKRDRLTSYLLTVDLNTGIKKYNKLNLTKAIHGLVSIDHYRLLAASTQTDMITEIAIDSNGEVVFEDVFFDLKSEIHYNVVYQFGIYPHSTFNYRSEFKLDDIFHCNGIKINDRNIYISMFNSKNLNIVGIKKMGVILQLPNDSIIYEDLYQPHTIHFNGSNEILICDSGNFKLKNITTGKEYNCSGYTRGICEDSEGYWVGISKYRKFSKTLNKWNEQIKEESSINGAMLEHINFDMDKSSIVNLSSYGVQEIFDIIPASNDGKYNQ